MQHTTNLGLVKPDYVDAWDVMTMYNPNMDTLDGAITTAQLLGGQTSSQITVAATVVVAGSAWVQFTGLGILLPNTGKSYELQLWAPSLQTTALGTIRIGLGTSATTMLGYMRDQLTGINVPNGPAYVRTIVTGSGQTVGVYGYNTVASTLTLDAFTDSPAILTYQRVTI